MPVASNHRCKNCLDYLRVDDVDLCAPCSRDEVQRAIRRHAKAEARDPKKTIQMETVKEWDPEKKEWSFISRPVKRSLKAIQAGARLKNLDVCQRRIGRVKCKVPKSEHETVAGPLGTVHGNGCTGFLGLSPRELRRREVEARKEERRLKALQKEEEKKARALVREHRKRVKESLERQIMRKEERKVELRRGWESRGRHALATRRVKVEKEGKTRTRTKGKPLCGVKVKADSVLVKSSEPSCVTCLSIINRLKQKEAIMAKKKVQSSKKSKGSKKAKSSGRSSGVREWIREYFGSHKEASRKDFFSAGVKKFGPGVKGTLNTTLANIKRDEKILGFRLQEVLKRAK